MGKVIPFKRRPPAPADVGQAPFKGCSHDWQPIAASEDGAPASPSNSTTFRCAGCGALKTVCRKS